MVCSLAEHDSTQLTYMLLIFSVLRVWDVLLFEGNRVMLFRTALALMELYGMAFNMFFLFFKCWENPYHYASEDF